MNSNRPSRRGALRLSRQPTKNLSRGGTELSTLSIQSQATRGGKRKGVQSIKSLEEELKKAMPKGWNIREGFQVINPWQDFMHLYRYSYTVTGCYTVAQALSHFKKIVRFVIVFTNWIKALREE